MNRKQRRRAQSRKRNTPAVNSDGDRANVDEAGRLPKIEIERRNFSAAEQIYSRILDKLPDSAEAFNNRGLILYELKRYEEALDCFSTAARLRPRSAQFHVNRGNALSVLKRMPEALLSFERALVLEPANTKALIDRANALQQASRFAEAIADYDKAIALNPEEAIGHNNRGVALQALRRYREALASYEKAIALKSDYAEAFNNRSLTLRELGHLEDSLASCDRALTLWPAYVTAHNNRALTLYDMSRFDEALASCDRALAINPNYLEAHSNRGLILQELKLNDAALESLDRAIAINPGIAEAYQNRGSVLVNKGNMAEAERMFVRALELNPGLVNALYNLSKIRKYRDIDHPDVRKIHTLLREDLPAASKDALYFALGKIYDECSHYDEAFECYRRANRIRNERAGYDAANVTALVNNIIEVFSREFLSHSLNKSEFSAIPVFIVGMPRSGTTLLANVLSNHPLVDTAGELPTIAQLAQFLQSLSKEKVAYPRAARYLTTEIVEQMREQYEKRLCRDSRPEASYVIDKSPLNFLRLGFIQLLLPEARIIHCKREAMDTCLSNYFQRFELSYDYSFDLENIGHFYKQYVKMMEHWRRVLPEKIVEVEYEELVGDTEIVARRLLSYLGLDWHASCLSPHTNPCPVETASNWQVRQPIYRQAVERWRHYEKHLGPLVAALSK
jgi:tetratricopeptide (TPR) repeat protein